jgi:hypothetical protein
MYVVVRHYMQGSLKKISLIFFPSSPEGLRPHTTSSFIVVVVVGGCHDYIELTVTQVYLCLFPRSLSFIDWQQKRMKGGAPRKKKK